MVTHYEAYAATLNRLRDDLVAAESKAERLRAGIAAIESIIATDSAAPAARATGEAHASATAATPKDPRLKDATLEEAALIGLGHAARPLHVRDLYEVLGRLGYNKYRDFKLFRNSMTPALDRSRKISKVGSGLYAPTDQKVQFAGSELNLS
jgi:hypothetical protein